LKRLLILWIGGFLLCFLIGTFRLQPWIGLPLAGAVACSFLRDITLALVGATVCIAVCELALGLPPGAWAMGGGVAVILLRQVMRQGPPDWIDCFVAGVPIAILGVITSFALSLLSAVPPNLPSVIASASFLVTGLLLSRPLAFFLMGEETQSSWS